MTGPEFKSFSEIKGLHKIRMTISQKIHGTNAQFYVYKKDSGEMDVIAGSRTRWIYPDADNYGFAAFIQANKEAFILLGEGRHFGEWAGPGINSGEGLKEKTLILFDYNERYMDMPLPNNTQLVPVLYQGAIDMSQVELTMNDLRTNGSRLAPGFMRPEGIVIDVGTVKYKKVFDVEETKWKDGDKVRAPKQEGLDYSHLLQPVRLEKLLSRDESYLRDYPKSLGLICKEYMADLVKEEQITGDPDLIKATLKGASGQVFKFIRATVEASCTPYSHT